MTPSTTTSTPAVHASHRVLAVHPDTDAITALALMDDNGVRHLPVVRRACCEGLVTEAHLLRALAAPATVPLPTVGMLCHRPPLTVPADAAPPVIAAAIISGGLDAALVVHGGTLTGIVTSKDVLALSCANDAQGRALPPATTEPRLSPAEQARADERTAELDEGWRAAG
jgi:CBS domain-containing protein